MVPWSLLCIWAFVNLILSKSSSGIKFQNSDTKLGRSKLILFQGKERYELQGKDCPVGITFAKPERFSCACVTGVWSFYEEWCAPPIKVIGGYNHCFLMPPIWIQQVTVWSNPVRVLDTTLTVFDGEEEYMKLKVYRHTHITVTNTSNFVSHNSSWTLLNRDGPTICLNARIGRHDTKDHSDSSMTSVYCHFSNIQSYISEINTFKPGCHGKAQTVKPDRCDYYEDTNDESICNSYNVIRNYENLGSESREFRKRTRTTTTLYPLVNENTQSSEEERISPMKIEKILEEDIFDNGLNSDNMKRGKKSPRNPLLEENERGRRTGNRGRDIFVDFPSNPNEEPEMKIELTNQKRKNRIFVDFPLEDAEAESESATSKAEMKYREMKYPEMLESLKSIAERENRFLILNKSESNPFVLAQLWAYHKQTILTVLNLKRDDDMEVRRSSQIYQLLNVSKNIMQRTCEELVRPEFFNMAMETFLNVQRKNLHWKPPFIANDQFSRILQSLNTCLVRAEAFAFRSTSGCLIREPKNVYLNNTEKPLKVPQVFNSNGFEPIIESMWKVIINAHSYCYEDFSQFYNDHHRYTTLFTPIFTNGIYKIWFRNTMLALEYNGVAGKVDRLLREIDRCTVASRYVSAYPWDLRRPDMGNKVYGGLFRRRKRDLQSKKIRVQMPRDLEIDDRYTDMEKRLEVEDTRPDFVTRNENWEWKKNRRMLNGLGFCLKKFDEPKVRLGQMCE